VAPGSGSGSGYVAMWRLAVAVAVAVAVAGGEHRGGSLAQMRAFTESQLDFEKV
jgi:hypothetical protein